MRVLVTGASGYIGQAVVAALSSAGHSPVPMIRSQDATTVATARVADVLDPAALRRAVVGVDAVCHLAGLSRARQSVSEPLRYFRVNTCGTIALLEAMADSGVGHLVFASTGAIYGTPDQQPMPEDLPDMPPNPYASSKLAAELAIEANAASGSLSALIARLPNVAGGADPDRTRLIPRALSAASGGSALPINGDGSAVRDYLHITDVAAAFVACLEHMPSKGTSTRYNIGSGRGTSVRDVVTAIERVTGRSVELEHRPPAREPTTLILDASKAATELHWVPACSDVDSIVRDAWRAAQAA